MTHKKTSLLRLSGWRITALAALWIGLMVAGSHVTPPPTTIRPKPSVTQHDSDRIMCDGLDAALYGDASDHGKELAATINQEFNDLAETPISPIALAGAQMALLTYCQAHPAATLRAAVVATLQTLNLQDNYVQFFPY
jgi:hypothetical protein